MPLDGHPLPDIPENEVRQHLRELPHVEFNYNDYVAEPDRRAANRQARASFVLSAIGVGIALVALIVTALKT